MLLTLAVVVLLLGATQAGASPPTATDHGIVPETFVTLWSGDQDESSTVGTNGSDVPLAELAKVTDISFEDPPVAAEQWNRGDHREFPESDHTVSIRPSESTVTDGVVIRDAYAALFAVQPSTRLWRSDRSQPLYVGSSGQVLGTVDYRVQLPADDANANRRVEWQLLDHRIEEVRLRIDDTVVDQAQGTHTPALAFSDLSGSPGANHTVTLEATIAVELSKRTTQFEDGCTPEQTVTETTTETVTATETPTPSTEDRSCTTESSTVTTSVERLTVNESRAVVEYAPSVTGAYAQFPDGSQALALSGDQPRRGYTVGDTETLGVWRYYTSRETRWDTLVQDSGTNSSARPSPLQPLQVHAYPSKTGAKTKHPARVTNVDGEVADPPTLPESIDVDVVSTPYTTSETVITTGQPAFLNKVDVEGLVRGTGVDLRRASLRETTVHQSELTLTPQETTAETVTVEVKLLDANTGDPIQTANRNGTILLQNQSIETNAAGTTVVTVPRPVGALTVRYEPAPWWTTEQAYLQSSDTVYIEGTDIPIVPTLYQLGIPIGSFLVAVFLIGRLTGWDIWPLWGRQ